MGFLSQAKKHQYYFYVSLFFIGLFFIGNHILNNKVTAVTEVLVKGRFKEYLNDKQGNFKLDFINFNRYAFHNEKVKSISTPLLKEYLKFNCKLTIENENIDNSFAFLVKNNQVKDTIFCGFTNSEVKKIPRKKYFYKNRFIDTIISENNNVFYRKMAIYGLSDNSWVVTGYDINLHKYWKTLSEKETLQRGGYAILVNKEGTCLYHPNLDYIGKKIPSFFYGTSLKDELNNSKNKQGIKVTSEYLGLEVLRYYKPIKLQNTSLILIVDFPVQISLKEAVSEIMNYFYLISFLALCTFMLILGMSRLRLRKEFDKNIKYEQEKKKLAIINEQYLQRNAVLQLDQLKKKMNPHFLFNSLNSLLVLIDLNPKLSQEFVLKLAEVYRYLLEERESNLVSVKEELGFMEQYFFLHKIRFKKKINLDIIFKTAKKPLTKQIPFLALQTLIENAIKHNEITKSKPLFIEIIISDDLITVSNSYNPRKNDSSNSYKIGLNYLKNCYHYYGVNSFKTVIFNKKFNCYLPLLLKK